MKLHTGTVRIFSNYFYLLTAYQILTLEYIRISSFFEFYLTFGLLQICHLSFQSDKNAVSGKNIR